MAPSVDVVRIPWMAMLVALPLALAGCLGGDGDDREGHGDEPGDGRPALEAVIVVLLNGTPLAPQPLDAAANVTSGTGNATGPSAGNSTGSATATASGNGTTTATSTTGSTSPTNGTAVATGTGSLAVQVPMGATVTFDASRSSGAIVEYAWDFGDNSTGANRAEEHTYAEPGRYLVSLTVSAGNESANATLAVVVTGSVAGERLGTTSTPFAGELPAFNLNSCTVQGIDCQDHVIPVLAEFEGQPAMAVAARVNLTASGGSVQIQLFWRSPDGTNLAQSDGSPIVFAEPMAAGDYVVRVRVFIGASTSYAGTVDIDYASV